MTDRPASLPPRNPLCAGSRRGTDLRTFTTSNGRMLAQCGICAGSVTITIDGLAMPHQAVTS